MNYNSQALKTLIDESGFKITFIAKALGLTYQGLSNKLNNIATFKTNEVAILCSLLKIDDKTSNAIFFDPYSEDE